MAQLEARQASYRVGNSTLLHDVTMQLEAGKVHALVGPNGAGKSTLLQLLAGDFPPTSGDVYLDGRRLGDYAKKDLALRRAVMPQDVVLSLAFTSEEVVTMGRYPHMTGKNDLSGNRTRIGDHDHSEVVERMMQKTESIPLRERLYPTLSGGEQARVTLARVLAQQTSIIFLDEPTASLDPGHQHLVMQLAKLHAVEGGTVLAVLHDLNLAAAYADDIILLRDGRVRAHGSPRDVFQPSILDEVFLTNFHVSDHPLLPHPLVLSLPHPLTDSSPADAPE